jgi:hypothetical protein
MHRICCSGPLIVGARFAVWCCRPTAADDVVLLQKREEEHAAELYILADSLRSQYYATVSERNPDPLGLLLVKVFRQVCVACCLTQRCLGVCCVFGCYCVRFVVCFACLLALLLVCLLAD